MDRKTLAENPPDVKAWHELERTSLQTREQLLHQLGELEAPAQAAAQILWIDQPAGDTRA